MIFKRNKDKKAVFQISTFFSCKPSGIHIKWNEQNNSNLALDFGVSKNDWSLRLGLAENF